MQISRDDLARLYPRAIPAWLDALARLAPQLTEFYDFTRLDWVHFAGQIGAETDGLSLREMRENLRFTTAARILQVYNYRLGVALENDEQLRAKYRTKSALAAALVGQPDYLADVVYGGREGTPWMQGSRYIGRGPTQITHLDNYRAVGAEIQLQPGGQSVDLVYNPDALATEPELGVRAAFADWHLKRLSRWARADNTDAVSALLNTGSPHKTNIVNGLDRRRRWVARARGVWPATVERGATHEVAHGADSGDGTLAVLTEGSTGPAVREAQELLRARGYAVGAVDGVYGPLLARAVVALQHEHGLPVDGNLDAADWDVLRQTAPVDLGARATAQTLPGSRQIGAGHVAQRAAETVGAAGIVETAGQVVTGSSPTAAVVDALGQAGQIVGKFSVLGVRIEPHVGLLVLAGVAAVPLWLWGRRLVSARLAAYRSGLNLSR